MSGSKKSSLNFNWFSLAISLLVHLLILIVFSFHEKVEFTAPDKNSTEFVIEILNEGPVFSRIKNPEILAKSILKTNPKSNFSASRTRSQSKSQSESQSESQSQSKTLSRDILFPKYSFSAENHKSGEIEIEDKSSIYDKYAEGGVFHTMDSIGLDEYNSMSPFLQALWQKVDANLDYPEDFARQRLAGRVNVHLLVNDQGLFVGDFLELTGENDLLKTYVAASLVHALGSPLPKVKWNSERKTLPVLLSFNFETYSIPEPSSVRTNLSVKNALLFERRKFVDPKINEDIETFFTKYFPAIIPIGPGVLYIDFVYAYKMLSEYGKPTAREKRQERLEGLRESLSRSIKKKESLRKESEPF